jgi:hypothetical protein
MNSLHKLFNDSLLNNWCTQVPCTTCGSREFTDRLNTISSSSVIENLGALTAEEFFDNQKIIISVFKWLYFKGSITNPNDIESIRGSEAYRYFFSFYTDYHSRKKQKIKNYDRQLVEFEEAKVRRAQKASLNLPNAIKRGDQKAIEALIAKGGDPNCQ